MGQILSRTPAAAYELVDQLPLEDLESREFPIESDDLTTPEANSRTRSSSSSSSSSSVIFEEINTYSTKSGSEQQDFYDSPTFQSIFLRYKGSGSLSKKVCSALGFLSVLLWVVATIIYSQTSPKSLISSLTSQTNVEVSGQNITLNEYSPKFSNLSLSNFRRGSYYAFREPIVWLNSYQFSEENSGNAGGYHLVRTPQKSYAVKQINTDFSYDFLNSVQFAYMNNFFYIQDVIPNPGKSIKSPHTTHLVVTDKLKQWRHSSFAIYWLFNRDTATFTPIQPPENLDNLEHPKNPLDEEILDKLHFAEFSPQGNYVVFGFDHDLYLQDVKTNEIKQITDDGSRHIFNGKPDWAYEEEVTADYKLFWWSQDEENLVFARLDDTNVQDYELDFYIKDKTEIGIQYEESDQDQVEKVNQYPIKTSIKYPKPGTANPIVSIYNYKPRDNQKVKLDIEDTSLGEDFVFYQGVWIDNQSFLMKHSDRSSRVMNKMIFKPNESNKVKKVNSLDSSDYKGWIPKQYPVAVIPSDSGNKYIDKVVVHDRAHIALFDSASSESYSKLLTDSKDWDVIWSSPVVYDPIENYVYILTTERSSMDSHLVAVDLSHDENNLRAITSTKQDGLYDVDFSANGQYLNLNYRGPDQAWQRLINMGDIHGYLENEKNKVKEKDSESVESSAEPRLDSTGNEDGVDKIIQQSPTINHFEVTSKNLKDTNLPTKVYKTVTVGKFKDKSPIDLNIIEILPPNFNPKKKYPVLVHVYGGPGSQTVDKSFGIDFQDIASAALDIIVLTIDPRGTGGRDWKFQSMAKDRIGFWEPRDITNVVSEYLSVNKAFIDKEKTALWGWSYGGFTTLKTLEYDAGKTFKFGMAVAPVTNWLFYDSIYTERYMGLPSQNPLYKTYARVSNYEKFKSVKRFLIMHGTGDDNVHLQNSLWLLDKFNLNSVENYDVHFFPDSDHAIDFHNSNSMVYDKLLFWLRDAFRGKFEGYQDLL